MNEQHSKLVEQLIPHMPFVMSCRESLQSMGLWWQRVAMVGKINSLDVAQTLLEQMDETKRRFEGLQEQLIDSLSRETLRGLDSELTFRSRILIDMLIRNLFERTADVGFLATDADIRQFMAEDAPGDAQRVGIEARLQQYRAKYSVYEEIVLLDRQGRVLANMDQSSDLPAVTQDSLVSEVLSMTGPYLERLKATDLRPQRPQAHCFAAPVRASDSPDAPVLGVLCLFFNLQEELKALFASLVRGDTTMALLDAGGCVLVSSNPRVLPAGDRVPAEAQGLHPVLARVDDKPCLIHAVPGQAYEGYRGLDWRACFVQPLATAFAISSQDDTVESRGSDEPTGQPSADGASSELDSIVQRAHRITSDLTLTVYNGQIIAAKQDATEFKPVLDEIRHIGNETRALFQASISRLRRTMMESKKAEGRLRAFLAVDIMDRNLYERANDVRWWAQNGRLRALLSQSTLSEGDREELRSILVYINELYTVYTNLILFDRRGMAVAVSNPDEVHWIGQAMSEHLPLEAVWSLDDSLRYAVSAFAPNALYGGDASYVYLASIQSSSGGGSTGGLAIVFDARPQFEAMLNAAIQDESGQVIEGASAVFLDDRYRVLASTDRTHVIGQVLDIDSRFHDLRPGERQSFIGEQGGVTCALSAAVSQGYREYKTVDGYTNQVTALVTMPV